MGKSYKNIHPPIRIHVNQAENRIKFRIKVGYCIKLLKTETLELLGVTESKINKDDNCKH